MTLAVIILGVIAILSLAMAAALLTRLLKTRSIEQSQETFLGHQVTEVRNSLSKVETAVVELKTVGAGQTSQIKTQLDGVTSLMATLNSTNTALREALANTQVRGQWGERMAEDVFRIIGFVEGVNYVKQPTLPGSGSRPDFTINMPQNKKLNMDVKFPLANYMKCLEAESPEAEEAFRQDFLRDVRDRAKEVVGREYIDPGQNTLDYVLVFIPNEQVYQFIQQYGSATVEEALRNKVVLCSPMTLFAILSIVRHALDNFAMQEASDEIVSQLGLFDKQWIEFVKQMDTVGRRIESTQKGFEALVGTRRRALERPLNRIASIRRERGLSLPEEIGEGVVPEETERDPLELAETTGQES
ncbi:MAG: DNA recombination protein RmuC [Chloroflexi bacterium]|nr:DNA recombination protein RmuC [Chloroflexota bacterium]